MASGDGAAPEPSVQPKVAGADRELSEGPEAWAQPEGRWLPALPAPQALQVQAAPPERQERTNRARLGVSVPKALQAKHSLKVQRLSVRAAEPRTQPAWQYSAVAAEHRRGQSPLLEGKEREGLREGQPLEPLEPLAVRPAAVPVAGQTPQRELRAEGQPPETAPPQHEPRLGKRVGQKIQPAIPREIPRSQALWPKERSDSAPPREAWLQPRAQPLQAVGEPHWKA